jgi:hypothetical protein
MRGAKLAPDDAKIKLWKWLPHGPEKWEPAFRKDHAQTKIDLLNPKS